jgi:acyl-CoA synthetase (AMP-forming)/AMP-acid ligase II
MLLNELLESAVSKYPEKTAIRFGDLAFTYADFYRRVRALAGALQQRGVARQSKVAVIAPNSHRYLETVFACALLGSVSEHFNGKLAPPVICRLLEESTATVVMISRLFGETAKYLREHLSREILIVEGGIGLNYEELLAEGAEPVPANWSEDEVVLELYTSGTTGKPKGVLLTAAALRTQVLVSAVEGRWTHDEVFLCVLPLYHTTCISVFQLLLVGGELVVSSNCQPTEIAWLIDRYGVTRTTLVPHLLNELLAEVEADFCRLQSLRTINYGGAPMSPELMARCQKSLSCVFHQAYGMTEMTASVTVLLPEMHSDLSLLNTVGKPMLGVEIRVVGDEGEVLPAFAKGEILVKSATLMKGYYNNPELTNAVVREGWYHTGDIGYLDSRGFLYLVSRKQDMIISGGENIYPQEVAACIREMSDAIKDVAVVGIPDAHLGESVAAAVVLKGGATIAASDIADYCSRKLGRYFKPRHICFLPNLPRYENGKISREKVKALFAES